MYKLQIVQGEKLTEKARNQQMVTLQLFIPRQIGVDRNNKILAFDRLVYTLYAHPKLVEKSDEQVAQKLGQTHLKYKNPLIARVSAFFNVAYFFIKIHAQQGFQKSRAFALRVWACSTK